MKCIKFELHLFFSSKNFFISLELFFLSNASFSNVVTSVTRPPVIIVDCRISALGSVAFGRFCRASLGQVRFRVNGDTHRDIKRDGDNYRAYTMRAYRSHFSATAGRLIDTRRRPLILHIRSPWPFFRTAAVAYRFCGTDGRPCGFDGKHTNGRNRKRNRIPHGRSHTGTWHRCARGQLAISSLA